MDITTPPADCPKCYRRGYYEMILTPVPGAPQQKSMMICACSYGKQLQQITVDLRLEDLKAVAEVILPMIEEAKAKLAMPSESGKILDTVKANLTALIGRVEEASKETK